jgi:hypothetical protein
VTARTESFPRTVQAREGIKPFKIRGGTALTIYVGDPIAHRRGSFLAEVPDASAPRDDLIFVGWSQNEITITTATDSDGAAVDADSVAVQINVEAGVGCGLDTGAGVNEITAAHVGLISYGYDNNTAYLTSNNGQLSPLGRIERVDEDGTICVDVDESQFTWLLAQGQSDDEAEGFAVRNVVTALGAYTASAGTITVTATGALASQDGITVAAGDEVWLPEYTNTANSSVTVSAANSGPYRIKNAGGSGVSAVLTRPAWWSHGAAMPLGASVKVAEGTLFANSVWDIGAAKGSTIGTTDPAAYPRSVTQTVALSSSAAAIINVPIRSATKSNVIASLAAVGGTTTNTIGWGIIVAPTPGALGTATTTVNAIASGGTKNGTSDTSSLIVTIVN